MKKIREAVNKYYNLKEWKKYLICLIVPTVFFFLTSAMHFPTLGLPYDYISLGLSVLIGVIFVVGLRKRTVVKLVIISIYIPTCTWWLYMFAFAIQGILHDNWL